MTSEFFYSARYQTQCIALNAQEAGVPQGTIIAVKSTPDGTFDVIGAGTGAYSVPYGVLLRDAPAAAAVQAADVIVIGELFKDFVDGVYKAANSGTALTAAQIAALRNIGIILK
jgi:hypothetical protein